VATTIQISRSDLSNHAGAAVAGRARNFRKGEAMKSRADNYDMRLANAEPKEGDLQVWHIPQIPGKSFLVAVKTPEEAKRVLDILAEYDLFQYAARIKPDYSNAGGLTVFESGEWVEWENEDGESINELQLDEGGSLM